MLYNEIVKFKEFKKFILHNKSNIKLLGEINVPTNEHILQYYILKYLADVYKFTTFVSYFDILVVDVGTKPTTRLPYTVINDWRVILHTTSTILEDVDSVMLQYNNLIVELFKMLDAND